MRGCIFASLRRITLKLGKFTNTKALFLVVSTDFPNWMSKVEKSVKVDLATCELYNWMKTIPLLVCAAEARRPRSLNFVFLFTQSLLSSGSIQFEFEILGNIQRELLKQHQSTWCYSWLKLVHFRKMVKLDGFIKNENCFLKNHKYENMCLRPCPH